MVPNLIEAEILSPVGKVRVVLFIAGLVEFALSGMMFLMACYSLTGYLIFARPYLMLHSVALGIEFYVGILAIVAFIFGLAGSISAADRWSLLLSVFGASLITCWGFLENWYTVTWLTDPSDIQTGITFGTIAIFFSLLVIILVVASKEHFKIPLLKPRHVFV
jgi:hypothetical protein